MGRSALSPAPLARSFPARTTLTQGDRVVLRAIAEAMFSQDGEVELARLDAHLDELDALISAASKPLRFALRVALLVVRVAPLLFFFRMRTIERLAIDDRVAVLSRLERSRFINLSLAFVGWRSLMTVVFYEHPTELDNLGYASERKIYKRHLATLVPVPEDSGVRLRDADARDRDSETPPAAAHARDSEAPPAAPAAAPGKSSREVA